MSSEQTSEEENRGAAAARTARRVKAACGAVLLLLVLHDFAVPTGRGFAARTALYAIDAYRAAISPRLHGIVECRFIPSCSAYGRESIRKHGFAVGSAKTAWRIARCGPWTPAGTSDPP